MKPIILILLMSASVNAGTVTLPNLIAGPIQGNDKPSIISYLVGHEVERVGKFEFEGDEYDFSVLTEGIADNLELTFTDQGLAFFFSSGIIQGSVNETNWDYLAIKSGPNFFLFDRTGPLTLFETNCHFISHATLYKSIPEPGSWVLILFALLGSYGFVRAIL